MSEQQLPVEPETAPIPPPVAVPPPKQNPTAYVILSESEQSGNWKVAGTVTAPGSAAAVRAHATKNGVTAGKLVAVPVRSWQPVTIKTETSTKLVIG